MKQNVLLAVRLALLLALLLWATAADATAQVRATPRAVAMPRDGGTLHLDTGTWTRRTHSQVQLGADVLYDNTCVSGYFLPLENTTFVDEGRLPSISAPAPAGCQDDYRVDGFTFSYCTDQPAASFGSYTHRFYQSYTPCAPITGVAPTATVVLNGLPASGGLSTYSCWTVTIDLGITGSFVMAADGDGTYQGGASADRFGWAMSSTAAGTQTGPWISGDPVACAEGAGTVFSGQPGPGTGLGNRDMFRITEVPPGSPTYLDACHFFGGAPFAGFDLRLHGDACGATTLPGILLCPGDGSGSHTPCPCGNHSPVGAMAGCLNSFGLGGKLRAYGVASISNDLLSLLGSDMTNAPCLYYQGTTPQNGGNGNVFGDGLRCAGGSVVRLGTKTNGAGASQYPGPNDPRIAARGGVTAPGTRVYQAWYRNSAAFCTPFGFNLTNGVEILWVP